ncbi:uncharacterized protein LOC115889236 isoform X3 [Sitophilus oryzae]|uniref:Uncharacterized protein LOC115889236 isoform X3 n=1 Tax=Sitophilus oryzae TaxID=7048 RepID=A0A6J2YLZ4_SITOR|nr:uncharacterized protein LOC115889236 isoform X3 [Sitophilus oryzae]
MDSRREDTKYHKCELHGERDDVVTSFIDAGIFINTRRRLKRYNYFLETLNEVRLYTGFSTYLFLVLKSILNFVCFIVVLSTMVYRILREFSVYKDKTAGDFAASVVQVVMMVSHGRHTSELLSDKLISILLVLCGFVIHLLVLVYAMEIWYKFYSCENKQNTVYDAVDALIRYKALPVEKRKRIFLYLNFKYQRKYYKESTIVKITSEALRREILVRISRESTQRVILFNQLPETILEKLRASLSCEIYLPGDVIIKAGMLGRCMFFILAGTVVVKTPKGKEVCYLRDGAHFGEISLVVNVARVATVEAVTPCQVFRLNRRQFLTVVRHHPDLLKQIHAQALERYADTTTLHTDGSELTSSSELFEVTDPDVENRASK